MSSDKKSTVLSHNKGISPEVMEELLIEQQKTNRLLGKLICSIAVTNKHLSEITDIEFDD